MSDKEKRPPIPDEYDPFGKTFPDKKNPSSPAEVEIPKAPRPEDTGELGAEFIGVALLCAAIVVFFFWSKQQGVAAAA